MASTAYNTILITVNEHNGERPIYSKLAAAAVTPGEFLEISSGQVQAHSGAAGTNVQKIVCVETPTAPSGASKAIDTDYAVGASVRIIYPQTGDEVYAWLIDGDNAAEGAALESNGTGDLQLATTGDVLCYASEALNNTTGARARLKVRVA